MLHFHIPRVNTGVHGRAVNHAALSAYVSRSTGRFEYPAFTFAYPRLPMALSL